MRRPNKTMMVVVVAIISISTVLNCVRLQQRVLARQSVPFMTSNARRAAEDLLHHPKSSARANMLARHSSNTAAGIRSSLPVGAAHDVLKAASRSSPLAAAIPLIIHQNYMAGKEALEHEATQPRSHFRRDWWRSCQTHHPSWTHMFWDRAAAEALLVARYSWFLPTFRSYNSVVLQSDALRPFILHAYGGIYLDLDTECYIPMDNSLKEVPWLINNAQMGSAAGHPIWPLVMSRLVEQADANVTDPLFATGPNVVTESFKVLAGAEPHSQDLAGWYPAAVGGAVRVYGPKEWFTPCGWDGWDCRMQLSRNRTAMRRQQAVVGVHQFSGSWLTWNDPGRSLALMNEGIPGIVAFFQDAAAFAECQCQLPVLVPSSSPPLIAAVTEKQQQQQRQQRQQRPPLPANLPPILSSSLNGWLSISQLLISAPAGLPLAPKQSTNGAGLPPASVLAKEVVASALAAAPMLAAGPIEHHSTSQATAKKGYALCGEGLQAALQTNSCRVYSVRQMLPELSTPNTAATTTDCSRGSAHEGCARIWFQFDLENELAAAGCEVHLFTDVPEATLQQPDATHTSTNNGTNGSGNNDNVGAAGGGRSEAHSRSESGRGEHVASQARLSKAVTVHLVRLGVVDDPFVAVPVLTLQTLMEDVGAARPVTVLYVDCEDCIWPSIYHLFLRGSSALRHVDQLVLDTGILMEHSRHHAYALYQHLYQELGFLGLYTAPLWTAHSEPPMEAHAGFDDEVLKLPGDGTLLSRVTKGGFEDATTINARMSDVVADSNADGRQYTRLGGRRPSRSTPEVADDHGVTGRKPARSAALQPQETRCVYNRVAQPDIGHKQELRLAMPRTRMVFVQPSN